MRALGNRSGDVMRLVVMEAVLMGLMGALLGTALGWGTAWGLSEVGIPMPPPPNSNLEYVARIRLSPGVVAGAAIIGIVATVIASIVPAIRVSRLPIVEALRRIA
jgi:putative ABC transport system permease protein